MAIAGGALGYTEVYCQMSAMTLYERGGQRTKGPTNCLPFCMVNVHIVAVKVIGLGLMQIVVHPNLRNIDLHNLTHSLINIPKP